jgi:hypothetical protein
MFNYIPEIILAFASLFSDPDKLNSMPYHREKDCDITLIPNTVHKESDIPP